MNADEHAGRKRWYTNCVAADSCRQAIIWILNETTQRICHLDE